MFIELFAIFLLSLLLMAFGLFFVVQFYNIMFRGYAPFVTTDKRVIKKLVEIIELKETDVLYDLGCGHGYFVRQIEKKYPRNKIIGIEYSFWPYYISKIQQAFSGSKIIMQRKNIFKADISEASVIYAYLVPDMMGQIEDKIKRECRPGTRVICYQFSLKNIAPEKIVDLDEDKDSLLHRKLFFYTI